MRKSAIVCFGDILGVSAADEGRMSGLVLYSPDWPFAGTMSPYFVLLRIIMEH